MSDLDRTPDDGSHGGSPTGIGRPAVPMPVVVAVGVLLALPVLALLWVNSYASDSPRLWGFPFFYWYQFLWVFLAAGCTWSAFTLLRRSRGDR